LLGYLRKQGPRKARDFLHFDAAIHDNAQLISPVENGPIDHFALRIEPANLIKKLDLPPPQILQVSRLGNCLSGRAVTCPSGLLRIATC